MKKITLFLLIIATLTFVGCSAKNNEPADLRGNWIESEHNEKDTYMIATIDDNTIEVNWCMDNGESTAIYWAGSFIAPTTDGDYSWDSVNDTDKTSFSLLASGAETKSFSYANGEILFEVTALGITKTVHLVRNGD